MHNLGSQRWRWRFFLLDPFLWSWASELGCLKSQCWQLRLEEESLCCLVERDGYIAIAAQVQYFITTLNFINVRKINTDLSKATKSILRSNGNFLYRAQFLSTTKNYRRWSCLLKIVNSCRTRTILILRIQLKLNTALLSTCPSVCSLQAWYLTFLTYIKA